MSSLIQWPFKRKQYTGIQNPRYVSDIVSANEAVIDAMKSLGGFAATGFAILSGMVYDSVAFTYTAGIFYLNNSFYSIAAFNEGVYLIGSSIDIKPSPFPDTTNKPIYTSFAGTTTTNPFGASPIFAGNMDAYRVNLSKLKVDLTAAQTILGTLKNAATKDVGTTAGTVAAGDASYSKAYINDALTTVLRVLYSGSVMIGDLPGGSGTDYTVAFAELPTGDYFVNGSIVSNPGSLNPDNDTSIMWTVRSRTSTGFILHLREYLNVTQNVSFEYVLIPK